MEMPLGLWYSDKLLEGALNNGNITNTDIDNAVIRTLTSMYAIGLFDRRPDVNQLASADHADLVTEYAAVEDVQRGNPLKNVTSAEHNSLAREIAGKSTVLLKNSGKLLPLTPNVVMSNSNSNNAACIAVIGDQSVIAGGGSGHVTPYYTVTQSQGIQNYLDAHTSDYPNVRVLYNDGTNVTSATETASSCGVAVVVVATTSSEGSDRVTLSLGADQDALVSEVAAVNRNTVVSVITPGASLMPWVNEV
jgi:beta-glucosidase